MADVALTSLDASMGISATAPSVDSNVSLTSVDAAAGVSATAPTLYIATDDEARSGFVAVHPVRDGYAVTPVPDFVSVQEEGSSAWSRSLQPFECCRVSLVWRLRTESSMTGLVFVVNSGVPFETALLTLPALGDAIDPTGQDAPYDFDDYTDHYCWPIPGTLQITETKAFRYVVALEVYAVKSSLMER